VVRWRTGSDLPRTTRREPLGPELVERAGRTTEHPVRKPRSKLNNLDKTLDLIRLGEERVRLPSLCWIGVSAGVDSVR